MRGTPQRPRLVVFRSNKHIYAQLVDDKSGKVITGSSTLSAGIKDKEIKKNTKEAAQELGKMIAQAAKDRKINSVCFDRGGYRFHGRVKSLAEGARQGGLKF